MSWQTIDEFAALIQPLLGRSCWWLYCDLCNRTLAELAHLSTKDELALQHCDTRFDYGNLMIQFDGGNDDKDLTFTHDFYRDGMGGSPVWALRVIDKSIPALWADNLDTYRSDRRSTHYKQCQLFTLEWRMRCGVSSNDSFILTAAWAVPEDMVTLDDPEPCMSAVALQFDYTCQIHPLPPVSDVPDWLKPGLLERMTDKLDRAIGHKESKAPPRTGTIFLGMTFPVNDEDAEISYFFQDRLPDGLGWKQVAGVTAHELGQKDEAS